VDNDRAPWPSAPRVKQSSVRTDSPDAVIRCRDFGVDILELCWRAPQIMMASMVDLTAWETAGRSSNGWNYPENSPVEGEKPPKFTVCKAHSASARRPQGFEDLGPRRAEQIQGFHGQSIAIIDIILFYFKMLYLPAILSRLPVRQKKSPEKGAPGPNHPGQ
jgi:hypothetical protein